MLLGVPDSALESQLAAAAARGDRSAVIFGSAYDVPGQPPGLRARLARIARSAGMALCGAGCMGFVNVARGLRAVGYVEPDPVPAGPVALVTHSGSVFSTMLRNRRGIGFSVAVSSGQELVSTAADYARYALELPQTRVLALVLEAIRDAGALRAVLAEASAAGVPVVLLAAGGSDQGRELVTAHSGALASGDGAWEALADAYGMHRAGDLAELADTLELFAIGRRARGGGAGSGIATIHDSGLERAHVADLAGRLGVPFADIGPGTRDRLAAVLDPGLEPGQPARHLGDRPGRRTAVRRVPDRDVRRSGGGGGRARGRPGPRVRRRPVLPAGAADGRGAHGQAAGGAGRAARIHRPGGGGAAARGRGAGSRRRAHRAARPAASARSPGQGAGPGRRAGQLPEPVAGAATGRMTRAQLAGRRSGAGGAQRPADDPGRRGRWADALARGQLGGAGLPAMLRDYGIPAVQVRAADTREAALAAAGQIGYPVVLKTDEPGVAHKSDVGGVLLGLDGPDALAAGYSDLSARLGPRVLVCQTAAPGTEMLLGIVRDPALGPLIVVGAGGVLTELLADRVVALPPVDHCGALRMLRRLRVSAVLDGARGQPAADLAGIAAAITGLSALACELGDALDALDINPLICGPGGAVAVDALVVTRPAARADRGRHREPRPAVAAYPGRAGVIGHSAPEFR